MIKNHAEAIDAFLSGEKEGSVNNLRIVDRGVRTALIHFNTVIAERSLDGRVLHYNTTRYGSSTSRIQNALINSVDKSMVVIRHYDIDIETENLWA